MTDDEREALLERMAEAAYQASNPVWPWKERGKAVKVIWRSYARAALAVAEPAVREDCAARVDATFEKRRQQMLEARVGGDTAKDQALHNEALTLCFLAGEIRSDGWKTQSGQGDA